MASILRTLTVTFGLLTMAGCTLVPGFNVDVDLLVKEESFDIYPKINVRLINPSLLSELQVSKPFAQTNKKLEKEVNKYTYFIGRGDILNITVWDHPELTTPAGQYRSAGEAGNVVHSDGTIFYPYIGKIVVVNKTVNDVRDLVTAKLARYIESPQIDVSVAAYRSQRVFVTGEVNIPSVLPISDVPLTLLDALNLSGGMSENADWRSVVLTSETSEGSYDESLDLNALYQKGDMSQNRLLSHNDILHIPRNDALKVFVMGDVKIPSTQRMDRSYMTLAEAINNAGGVDEGSANASGVFVLRASNQPDKLVDVFQLDASDGAMLILSTQFELKPLDIVYVTSAPIARWNSVISQLIPTFSLLRRAKKTE
ncbi:MAG: polysaccharide export protein [Sinobacterium sp.]